MKKIIGLDLGTTSIGWAYVNEAENEHERSSIVRLGVRVNPVTADELQDFEKGKSITTNADRTLKRSMRRNLQRYKLRREALIEILRTSGFINDDTLLSENGNRTTFETYRLRAEAVEKEISLEELARVFLMINKKRGYKSNRKLKGDDDGFFIDGISVAKQLYDEDLTPGMLCLRLLEEGKTNLPDFYCSDLQAEFDRIWNFQKQFYPDVLTESVRQELRGKNKNQTWMILQKYFVWEENSNEWNADESRTETVSVKRSLKGISRSTKGLDKKKETFGWREKSLSEKMEPEKLAIVLQEVNGQIQSSGGYLGAISDRSKVLYMNKLTVGQYLKQMIDEKPNESLKNVVFFRQDYLDEFNAIWEKQAEYHKELTPELKQTIRDVIIFYQRRLKSQKKRVCLCEFEKREMEIDKEGKRQTKVIGCRVIPRSHPLFQEFKIWQVLNNIEVFVSGTGKKPKKRNEPSLFDSLEDKYCDYGRRGLSLEEKECLARELSIKDCLKKSEVIQLLFGNNKDIDMNFAQIDGNKTGFALFSAFSKMMEASGHEPLDFKKPVADIFEQIEIVFKALGWNTDVLSIDLNKDNKDIEKQPYFRLWHLLYSFEGDNSRTGNERLIEKLTDICHAPKEYAAILANISFVDDYGSLSAKAIKNILPYLKEGNKYDLACLYAGYKHSKSSLTKEEIANKPLKDNLTVLPKNSLRNPIVEKILNQMVHVVNGLIKEYGAPDEIRVELARELKKNAKERDAITKLVTQNKKANEEIIKKLKEEFGLKTVSRNDIVRYKLYMELSENGFKTLYSNKAIPKEKLFGKEIDIEHIIPQSRVFDDSLSNKTLEYRDVNIEKGNQTAYDYVKNKYGEEGLKNYISRCESLFKDNRAKLRKLKMSETEIGDGFVDRDLRNTQYISRKASEMLGEICRRVVATTGSVTDELRTDWQLVDVMKELNLPKFETLGEVDIVEDRDGRKIKRIRDWSKRNDHRHHAMDALTIAFTKDVFIQYYNNKNAAWMSSSKDHSNIIAIKNKYFKEGKAVSPMPLHVFREEAKKHLENILVSVKAKNKVVTLNVNTSKCKVGNLKRIQQTPRGPLHKDTVYGRIKHYDTKEEKINASFTYEKIKTVCKRVYREALLKRLDMFDGDAKKAFTGKNALSKNPLYWDKDSRHAVPEKVKTVSFVTVYTTRKLISPELDIEKVVDRGVRKLLKDRIEKYGNAKDAFSNLDENPIVIDKEKGIKVKRVKIKGISNAEALHYKKDKDGHVILSDDGNKIPVDFVNTGSNHHVAIFRRPECDKQGNILSDENGNTLYKLEEHIVSFYEAVARANQGLPVVDKEYRHGEGWQFMFTMKQNEYFVFPNVKTGFDPNEIDLLNPANYSSISPNLFRVQKLSSKDYYFRHHLETTVKVDAKLKDMTFKRITNIALLENIVKVRVNHIGRIVSVGEY